MPAQAIVKFFCYGCEGLCKFSIPVWGDPNVLLQEPRRVNLECCHCKRKNSVEVWLYGPNVVKGSEVA